MWQCLVVILVLSNEIGLELYKEIKQISNIVYLKHGNKYITDLHSNLVLNSKSSLFDIRTLFEYVS